MVFNVSVVRERRVRVERHVPSIAEEAGKLRARPIPTIFASGFEQTTRNERWEGDITGSRKNTNDSLGSMAIPPRIIIDSANVSCKCAAQVNTIHFQ